MYKLHAFAQSGNAYKVAVLLQALRQPWTAVHMPFADFASGVPRSDAFGKTSTPWAKSPSSRSATASSTQSAAIMLYLSNKHWRIRRPIRRRAAKCCAGCSSTITSSPATSRRWRFTKAFAPVGAGSRHREMAARPRSTMPSASSTSSYLANREYVVGTQPTIADMSLCGYVYFPARRERLRPCASSTRRSALGRAPETAPGVETALRIASGRACAATLVIDEFCRSRLTSSIRGRRRSNSAPRKPCTAASASPPETRSSSFASENEGGPGLVARGEVTRHPRLRRRAALSRPDAAREHQGETKCTLPEAACLGGASSSRTPTGRTGGLKRS